MKNAPTKCFVVVAMMALGCGAAADAKRRVAAAPRCWTVPQITAAKINELSVLLNVQSLRCRGEDSTILNQYDSFTRASGSTMRGIAGTVKGHFGGSASLYDRYAISIANKYGAGVKGESCGNVASLMQAATTSGGSASGLSQVAETANIDPTITGGACGLHTSKAVKSKSKSRRNK